MHEQTAEAVQQAQLGDQRLTGLGQEADLNEELNEKRRHAEEVIEQLRQHGASDADVAHQQSMTAGLQDQLNLYQRQTEAAAALRTHHAADGKISEDELATERAALATAQQTLNRAKEMGVTVEDNLQIDLAQVRAADAKNRAWATGAQLIEKQAYQSHQLAEEQQHALDDLKQRSISQQEDQFRALADMYGDLFNGRTGDIWDHFKEAGLEVIAQLAAAWTLAQISGQRFDAGSALQQIGGSGNPLGSILGMFAGGGKGGGGAVGGVGGGQWAQLANLGGSFGSAGGGASGALGAIGSAGPYAAAAVAAFTILQQLGVFSSAKRGSATLGMSNGSLRVGSTRGNDSSSISNASGALGSVVDGLNRIAETLGGSVLGGGSVSIGQRDGNWRVDTTGKGITKTKKGARTLATIRRRLSGSRSPTR